MKPGALLHRLRSGALENVRFSDARALAEALGFEYVGGEGSHRIYASPGQPEQLNLQPLNGQAKPYQLRQLLRLIDRYGLVLP